MSKAGVNVAVFKWNNFRLIKANEIKFSGLPTSHVTLLQNTTLNANKTKITEVKPTNAIQMTFLCIEITIFVSLYTKVKFERGTRFKKI